MSVDTGTALTTLITVSCVPDATVDQTLTTFCPMTKVFLGLVSHARWRQKFTLTQINKEKSHFSLMHLASKKNNSSLMKKA